MQTLQQLYTCNHWAMYKVIVPTYPLHAIKSTKNIPRKQPLDPGFGLACRRRNMSARANMPRGAERLGSVRSTVSGSTTSEVRVCRKESTRASVNGNERNKSNAHCGASMPNPSSEHPFATSSCLSLYMFQYKRKDKASSKGTSGNGSSTTEPAGGCKTAFFQRRCFGIEDACKAVDASVETMEATKEETGSTASLCLWSKSPTSVEEPKPVTASA